MVHNNSMVENGVVDTDQSFDPFSSPANIARLEKIKRDYESGNAHYHEHELIDVDDKPQITRSSTRASRRS